MVVSRGQRVSATGEIFRRARLAQGLSVTEVARPAGLQIEEQVRVVEAIEHGRVLFPRKVYRQRFGEVLGIDESAMLEAMEKDYRRLERPVPAGDLFRIAAAVWGGAAENPDALLQASIRRIHRRWSCEHFALLGTRRARGVDLASRLKRAVRDSGFGYIRLLEVGRKGPSRRHEVVQEPCVLVPNIALRDGTPLADFNQHLLQWCLTSRLPVALRHTSVDGSIVSEIVDFKPDAEPPEPIDSQLYKSFGPAVRGFFELVWQQQGEPGGLLLVRYADRPTNRIQSAELHRQGDLGSVFYESLAEAIDHAVEELGLTRDGTG